MTTAKKGIWLARKLEKSSKDEVVFVGEEEEERENFALTDNAPEKGKGSPLLARTADSTDAGTTNTNFTDSPASGANYAHISNSFIAGPADARKFSSHSVRNSIKFQNKVGSRTSNRSLGRGR
jgi:hypothetical protein